MPRPNIGQLKNTISTFRQNVGGEYHWRPDSLNALWGWWDASSADNFELTGTDIDKWKDSGPEGNDLVPVVADDPAQFVINQLNGLPIVRVTPGPPATRLMLVGDAEPDFVKKDGPKTFMAIGKKTSPFTLYQWLGNATGPYYFSTMGASNQDKVFSVGSSSEIVQVTTTIPNDQHHVTFFTIDADNLGRRIYNFNDPGAENTNDPAMNLTPTWLFRLGGTASNGSNNDLAEIAIWQRTLNLDEINSLIDNYITPKWGLVKP